MSYLTRDGGPADGFCIHLDADVLDETIMVVSALSIAVREWASAGGLIKARCNARPGQPARPDRELANCDIPSGLQRHRGPRRYPRRGPPPHRPRCRHRPACLVGAVHRAPPYLADHAAVAYATTAHAALGRTTRTAHVQVDGLADRQAGTSR